MKTLLALALFGLLVLFASSAPAPADRAPRWEYAELSYRNTPQFRDAEETPRPPSVSIRWTTGAEDLTATGWADFSEKLKVPAPKKEASAVMQRIQLFNHLGSEGWELVGPTGSNTASKGFSASGTTWMFKRRVP